MMRIEVLRWSGPRFFRLRDLYDEMFDCMVKGFSFRLFGIYFCAVWKSK